MNHSLVRAMVLVWGIGKKWILVSAATRIVLAMLPLTTVWLTKELVNHVMKVISQKQIDVEQSLFLLLLFFLVAGTNHLLSMVMKVNDAKMEQILDYHLTKKVSEKAMAVPLSCYDQSDFFNRLHRMQSSLIGERFLDPLKTAMDIGQSMITLVSFLIFLVHTHWGLTLLSLICMVPILLIQTRFGMMEFFLAKTQTPEIREAHYIHEIVTSRESAKEVRIFQLKHYLIERWSNLYLQNMQKVIKLLRRRELAGFSSGLFTSAMYVSSLALIIYVMDLTAFTVGDFIALIQTVQNTQQLLAQMAHKLTVFYSNSFYLTDFFTFLDDYKEEANETPEQKTPFPADFQEGIAFEHVSFRYPGQTRDILKDVSFTIRKGERVAIVGDNGSGKTTLLKCLMGLYPVQSGAIRFDQVPVADMDPDDLHNHITVIFQDFMRYYFSVKDNIAVGKIEKANDFANIREVAKETGADRFIRKLPHDYETYIGGILREGQDLSGGQWQKIALSRALFRQGEVFILDEPTAALDPIAELEVFKQFEALTQNKTAIFISHRMAAARLADRILVLRNGRVAELGHHDELIQRNGVYAKMYHMQAKWYA